MKSKNVSVRPVRVLRAVQDLPDLRDYQRRGNKAIMEAVNSDNDRLLIVSPVGSGKGTLAAHGLMELERRGLRVLFLSHRRDILKEIHSRLLAHVGLQIPGERPDPSAPIQLASVQSLLGLNVRGYDALFADEAHHFAADEWREVVESHSGPIIGFTATPQRADGRAMGDVFDSLLPLVSYKRLLKEGLIVPCRILRPEACLGVDLAQDPVDAYMRYVRGQCAFVFVRSVEEAHQYTAKFKSVGVKAACIEGTTAKGLRDRTLKDVREGRLDVIVNVYTMTEGVDITRASAAILARSCDHESNYIQMAGRVLRAHPGKKRATLIDLTGVSYVHGSPTDDREYTLDGRGMGPGTGTGESRDAVERVKSEILDMDLYEINSEELESSPPPKLERVERKICTRKDVFDSISSDLRTNNMSIGRALKLMKGRK